MTKQRIEAILEKIGKVRIAVFGDFALDAYWMLEPGGSEISVETGLLAQAVRRHYYTLGGASNVTANIAALKPGRISVVGTVGEDLFGRELERKLSALGVDTTWLVKQAEKFDTVVFSKRYLHGKELERIDFGFFNEKSALTTAKLLEGFGLALKNNDAVIFNQQVPGNLEDDSFIEEINSLISAHPGIPVLVDSRNYGSRFKGAYLKMNEAEAAAFAGEEAGEGFSAETVAGYGKLLNGRYGKPIFITRGEKGIFAFEKDLCHRIPGIQILNDIDTVGAGDTITGTLALCLGAEIPITEASAFANIAAAVTIQKLFQTGTASAQEIIQLHDDVQYVYQPELAEDPRAARYIAGGGIEVCFSDNETPRFGNVRHVLFDHDGTISTLRRGWEEVMEPVMLKAILGIEYEKAENSQIEELRAYVRDYIDKSTGIQTIVQMEALTGIVKKFGFVPAGEVLDAAGYKALYDAELMEIVNKRMEMLMNGEKDSGDFIIPGAVTFLTKLKEMGMELYLASGTDYAGVVTEAKVLGYADVFEERIYGSLGDIKKYSKKKVIRKIIEDNGLNGDQLLVVGDGPVEIRECRRQNGIALGIASDEESFSGVNQEKRERLIKAGAHFIIPDFTHTEAILKTLHL